MSKKTVHLNRVPPLWICCSHMRDASVPMQNYITMLLEAAVALRRSTGVHPECSQKPSRRGLTRWLAASPPRAKLQTHDWSCPDLSSYCNLRLSYSGFYGNMLVGRKRSVPIKPARGCTLVPPASCHSLLALIASCYSFYSQLLLDAACC